MLIIYIIIEINIAQLKHPNKVSTCNAGEKGHGIRMLLFLAMNTQGFYDPSCIRPSSFRCHVQVLRIEMTSNYRTGVFCEAFMLFYTWKCLSIISQVSPLRRERSN